MNAIRNLARECNRRGLVSVVPSLPPKPQPPSLSLSSWHSLAAPTPLQLPQHAQQIRFKSKYISKSAKKRIPMTTKRAGKGYYKGKGATKEGRLTSKGRFIADPKKKLELVVPDLEGFKLKPYIARTASKIAPELRRRPGQV